MKANCLMTNSCNMRILLSTFLIRPIRSIRCPLFYFVQFVQFVVPFFNSFNSFNSLSPFSFVQFVVQTKQNHCPACRLRSIYRMQSLYSSAVMRPCAFNCRTRARADSSVLGPKLPTISSAERRRRVCCWVVCRC